jgi:hypothetical protein
MMRVNLQLSLMIVAMLTLLAAWPGGVEARARTQRVGVEPVWIEVPDSWRRREGPAEDNPHYDAPGPNPGLGPSVSIALEDAANGPHEDGDAGILGTERRIVDGHEAEVRHWRYEEEGSRGITVVLEEMRPGQRILVTGWTPEAEWGRRSGEIMRIIDSIRVGDDSAEGDVQDEAESVPVGPVKTFEVGNIGAVRNGPTRATVIKLKAPVFVRTLRTYHWNNARGVKPGTITLTAKDGTVLGPWPARGLPGQGGVRNAYWEAKIDARIEAGTYTISTSSDATWATNDEAGGRGFYTITWQEFGEDAPTIGGDTRAPTVGARPTDAIPTTPAESAAVREPVTGSRTAATAAGSLIFDGALGSRWNELGIAGGDFKKFARLDGGTLVVDVPAGSGWGKTGIWSKDTMLPAIAAGGMKLSFALDPGRTSSLVIALGSRADVEEWSAHELRVAWSRSEDGLSSRMTLWVRQREVMATRLGPDAPQRIDIEIAGNRAVKVAVPTGEQIETMLPEDLADKPMRVYALAHAPGAHKAARMALRSIALETMANAEASVAGDPQAPLVDKRSVTLFDGTLGTRWVANAAQGGDFAEHARLGRGGLVVDVPKDRAGAKVGIYSAEPVVWLDRFGEGASATLSFRFDAARTSGFMIALSVPGAGGVAGALPGEPVAILHWRKKAKGSGTRAALVLLPQSRTPVFDEQLLDVMPEEVKLVLTPRGLAVVADGVSDKVAPWSVLQGGHGLRVWVMSHPDESHQPVSMALKSITLEQTAGVETAAPPQQQAGVAPLPRRVLFSGAASADWEPIGIAGGDFAKFAKWSGKSLAIDVPAQSSWGKTGLLSAAPIAFLDERIYRTPYRVSVKVAPSATTGFVVALGTDKRADMWAATRLWISLVRQVDGRYVLSLHRTNYEAWSRTLAADLVERQWDGTLDVDLGDRWARVALGDLVAIRAPSGFDWLTRLHATIVSHPAREHAPARLTLENVSTGWVTPAGMSAAERYELIDNATFDRDDFLAGLAAGATRTPAGTEAGSSISAQEAIRLINVPQLAVKPAPPKPTAPAERRGSLLDWVNPIGTAHAQSTPAAPDCAKKIDDHIAEARRIEITLGEQGDITGALTDLGLTLLGKSKFEDGSWKETIRGVADRAVNAWQDGQAIGEDWNEDRAGEMVIHFMQAAMKIGLSSDALGDDRTFRDINRNVRETWAKALKNLPEDRARALIAELSQNFSAAIPHHDFYKEWLDKGSQIDFGAALGQGKEGERKAMLWTLANTTLTTFSPQYAIGKEIANVAVQAAKRAKAFVVNDRVRSMYEAWREEIAKNGGAGQDAFYAARTVIGDRVPLTEAKNLMRKSPNDPVSDAAAEAYLFKQFAKWYEAEKGAGKAADGLSKAKAGLATTRCRWEIERQLPPGAGGGDKCQYEIEVLKKYAELDAQIRGRLNAWMQPGNACSAPAAIDGEVQHLMCQLVQWGEDHYKASLGKHLEDCKLLDYGKDRGSIVDRVKQRLPKLNVHKLTALLDRAGVASADEFLNCLCQDGHGFHYYKGADAGGPCRRIGPLGGVTWSGFRVTDYSSCAKMHPLKDGRTVIDAIADTAMGIRIDQK